MTMVVSVTAMAMFPKVVAVVKVCGGGGGGVNVVVSRREEERRGNLLYTNSPNLWGLTCTVHRVVELLWAEQLSRWEQKIR